MNKYTLCNKSTGKVILTLYGGDFQPSDDGMHDYITESEDLDSRILWCWSHDSYLVGVEYDVEEPAKEEVVIFKKDKK